MLLLYLKYEIGRGRRQGDVLESRSTRSREMPRWRGMYEDKMFV
jgi:hypothetical protein